MKYVALLRGINVGGNNPVNMSELKAAFKKLGYTNVITYINSGNVIFESEEKDRRKIVIALEEMLTKNFAYKARVVVFSHEQMLQIEKDIPKEWKTDTDIRCYLGFLTEFATDEDIKVIKLREGVDSMKITKEVLYMTTLTSGLTKSGFTKIIGTKIYAEMTMRNYNTMKKIMLLMKN